jgi:flagellar basal-body rod protein FlgB
MPDPIHSITTTALALAMDAAALRQQAIAANIANHSTEGYVPQQVDFAAQMAQARRSLDETGRLDAAALAEIQPHLWPVLDANGLPAKVQLDEQMADMAQNAVRFQALAKGLSRHLSVLALAVNDGKR